MNLNLKEKIDPNAEQFRFYVFTRIKLGDESMKIYASFLTHVYGANCVSPCTVCRWTEGFRAGQVSFEDGHHPGRSVSVRNEQTVLFVKKRTGQNPHIAIREICERCDYSIGSAVRNVCNDRNLKKNGGKMDTPSPNRPARDRVG